MNELLTKLIEAKEKEVALLMESEAADKLATHTLYSYEDIQDVERLEGETASQAGTRYRKNMSALAQEARERYLIANSNTQIAQLLYQEDFEQQRRADYENRLDKIIEQNAEMNVMVAKALSKVV